MLQVVDDLDDTVNAVLHSCLGLNADLGMIAAAGLLLAAIACGLALGAATVVLCTAGGVLSVAFALKMLTVRQTLHPRPRRA